MAFSLDEANRHMIEFVPYMEEDLGRYDLEGYLRRPGSGSGYIIGKIQLEKMLSEQAMELRDDFNLGAFHDEVLSHGMIPLTLMRWEMTGADDEARALWREATGRELAVDRAEGTSDFGLQNADCRVQIWCPLGSLALCLWRVLIVCAARVCPWASAPISL